MSRHHSKVFKGARSIVPLAVLSILLLMGALAEGVTFAPVAALKDPEPTQVSQPAQIALEPVQPLFVDPLSSTPEAVAPTIEPAPSPVAATAAPLPIAAPPRVGAPIVAAATIQVAPPVASCPADWFCYPRLGVRGPIVSYADCTGATDVGTSIRSFACLSPSYLMGHAYTQFGKITQWHAGDVVWANGHSFTVTGAVIGRSCEPALLPLAPLSMQTSLSPNKCGDVLIVHAG